MVDYYASRVDFVGYFLNRIVDIVNLAAFNFPENDNLSQHYAALYPWGENSTRTNQVLYILLFLCIHIFNAGYRV